MANPTQREPVAVIGAGLTGLVAARRLADRGFPVRLFDKGRGPGGRASLRRAAPHAFDHGAQYFTARAPAFRRIVADWVRRGVVARWAGRIEVLGASAPRDEEPPVRYVGTPHMNALAKDLARGLDLRLRTRVARVDRDGEGWRLAADDGADLGAFRQVLVTLPPPQAAELLGSASHLAGLARAVPMEPCWCVLLGFPTPLPTSFDAAFCHGSPLAWVARDSSKPGRPAHESWVLHATSGWSRRHLERPPDEVCDALVEEFEGLLGDRLPPRTVTQVHLWRYARGGPAGGVPPTELLDRGLVLAGDAWRGGRIEGAVLAGLDAARALAPPGHPAQEGDLAGSEAGSDGWIRLRGSTRGAGS